MKKTQGPGWLKSPLFWKKESGLGKILSPLGWLYNAFIPCPPTSLETPPVPLICVGNGVVGGAGKTPVVVALLKHLKESVCVTRGYGGTESGPLRVKRGHTCQEVGDEALLLAEVAPTYIARDRLKGINLAIQEGAHLIILDDGLQNPKIPKTLALCVWSPLGNGYVFPAGPLRWQWKRTLHITDAILSFPEHQAEAQAHAEGKPVFTMFPHLSLPPLEGGYVAFAGIGQPERFFSALPEGGTHVTFGDHYIFREKDLERLEALAKKGERLICTEKDYVRLPAAWKPRVHPVPYEVNLELAFWNWLKNHLPSSSR